MVSGYISLFQSGFRSNPNSESVLLRVHNHMALSCDAVFECGVGIWSNALEWFSSYLANWSFSVMVGDLSSSHALLPHDIFSLPLCNFVLFCCMSILFLSSLDVKHFGYQLVVVKCWINKCWLTNWYLWNLGFPHTVIKSKCSDTFKAVCREKEIVNAKKSPELEC